MILPNKASDNLAVNNANRPKTKTRVLWNV